MHSYLSDIIVRGLQEAHKEPQLPVSVIEIRGGSSAVPNAGLTRWARQKLAMIPSFFRIVSYA